MCKFGKKIPPKVDCPEESAMAIPLRDTHASFRFGKLPPKIDYRTLVFGNYLKDDIPAPPICVNQAKRVCTELAHLPEYLFPMYANDRLGDCTIAGMAHGVTVYNGMVKYEHIPKESEVIRIYNHLTGGIDSGLYMLDVVKYWRTTGIEEHRIFAYANVSSHNHEHVKQAIWLFGGLFMGFQCQEKVLDEFRDRKPWQPGRKMNAGHAVYVTGYDSTGVEVLTWGTTQKGTWAWWDEHVDEAFALLPPEAEEEGFTTGFDFARLKKDLAEVAIS